MKVKLNNEEKEQLLSNLVELTISDRASVQLISPALGKLFNKLGWELPQTVDTTVRCGNEEAKYSTKIEVDEKWEEWH